MTNRLDIFSSVSTDDLVIKGQMMDLAHEMVENALGEGEIVDYQPFLLYPIMFVFKDPTNRT